MSETIRVLLVDDHAVMRAGFRMILEAERDITVVGEAASGLQALTAASELRPDVICMDVQMPEMDGLEATRRIRSGEASLNRDTPVIALTAHAVVDVQDRCLEAGMNGFITKPVRIEEIESRIAEVLSRS
mgnify:CR=1 FL=1